MTTLERLTRLDQIDRSRIEDLLEQESPGSPPPSEEELATALRNENFYLLVLKDSQDHYVGMGSIFFQRNLTRWMAEIHDVVVDDQERGKGYGDKMMDGLLDTAISFSKERSARFPLYLTSKPSRVAANNLYVKRGFQLIAGSHGETGTNLYRIIVAPDGFHAR